MLICHSKKFVFLAVPKTGTRSIYHLLKNKFNCSQKRDHTINIPSRCKNYYKFMTVRNPYSRLVSAWWSTVKRPKMLKTDRYHWIKKANGNTDFESILKAYIKYGDTYLLNHAIKQSAYFNVGVDKVLRFEYLEKDFNTLPFIKPPTKIPLKNQTYRDREPFYKYHSNTTIKLINEYYSQDFKIGNYVKYENLTELQNHYSKQ